MKVKVLSVAEERFVFESDDIQVGPNNHLNFANDDKHYGFHIHYELHGADGYRFPDDLSDAIYVEQGSLDYCPQSKSSWGIFKPRDVRAGNGGDRRVLVVENKNDDKKDFTYTLRAKNGADWLNLDPPGSNHNGGSPFTVEDSNTGIILGAVAAVAVLAVAFLALK
ncbi:hypothetical protein [Sphingomonas mesophila]|uniref:hypothetical protein n=1 Tax=Sphingomonas mesophila TaxID=2303576 RepID=UPI0013C2D6A4|nr:hypothetical protein [Sphingomonas mesophila]